jgi:GMP synthase (glutamine-hydrolysing)
LLVIKLIFLIGVDVTSMKNKILIIDFGSQYTQLLARRVRELGVYSEIISYDVDDATIKKINPKGIILSGGPETVTRKTTPRAPEIVFSLGCPVLGICYGMQVMALQLGGEVTAAEHHEYGHTKIICSEDSEIFKNIEDEIDITGQSVLSVWMSHGDQVTGVPSGFKISAKTKSVPVAAMENQQKNFYGLQFHPEVTHTLQGKRILERFVIDICACTPDWQPKNIIENLIQDIRTQVADEQVILGLSGGVDSSVVASLLHQAIGDQLTCIFVDTGLLRLNEAQEIQQTFAKHMGINLITVDAQEDFLEALKNIIDPEEKRKIIGHLFIEIFHQESKKLKNIKWLAQGTIYPDVIESAATSLNSHVIKSHHNVAGLPDELPFKLLEPLRELFKDEVRMIGSELGLPHKMVYRHPFPGPGLAVRILGEVRKEYVDILQYADDIFIEELRANDLYDKVAQAFAVFLPVKSVAVKGDARKHEYVISLRAVETDDFMTAKCAHLAHDFLTHVSNRIINEVAGVSRVTYDISSKPPATIEWE